MEYFSFFTPPDLSVCLRVCLSACLSVCLSVGVCMYVCMHACMHTCMHARMHTHTPTCLPDRSPALITGMDLNRLGERRADLSNQRYRLYMSIRIHKSFSLVLYQGIARTQPPTNINCTPESSTFGMIARVSPTV